MTHAPCSRRTAVAAFKANNCGRTQNDIVEAIMHIMSAAELKRSMATAAATSSNSQQHAGFPNPVLDFRDGCRDPTLQEDKKSYIQYMMGSCSTISSCGAYHGSRTTRKIDVLVGRHV